MDFLSFRIIQSITPKGEPLKGEPPKGEPPKGERQINFFIFASITHLKNRLQTRTSKKQSILRLKSSLA